MNAIFKCLSEGKIGAEVVLIWDDFGVGVRLGEILRTRLQRSQIDRTRQPRRDCFINPVDVQSGQKRCRRFQSWDHPGL